VLVRRKKSGANVSLSLCVSVRFFCMVGPLLAGAVAGRATNTGDATVKSPQGWGELVN